MLVGEARAQAKEWVELEASRTPGFLGAYLSGSTKWKPPDAPHLVSSDVDVRVIFDRPVPRTEWKKSRYRDILLEAGVATRRELGSPEELVANPILGGSLWNPVLLADPHGELAELGRRVTAQFTRRSWVEERASRARDLALLHLRRIGEAESFPEQVTCWLFGTSATTLVLLAAGLRNLTVKRRYAESRALLDEHARLDFHEEMLSWMGCADMQPGHARQHLEALAAAFDATAAHLDPAFRFAADLRPDARCVAIEGSRELIDAGLHREAVFWILATFSRCLQGLRSDAPDAVRALCDVGFRDLLGQLGLETRADLDARADHIRATVPRLEAVAEGIIGTTPEIVD
jgi:hypothetical protein